MTLRMKPSSHGTGRDKTDQDVVIEIGGIPIALETNDAGFVTLLRGRYGDYMRLGGKSEFKFRVELI